MTCYTFAHAQMHYVIYSVFIVLEEWANMKCQNLGGGATK